ncbi:hypothetical protein TSUD_258730 [Trifolium subterraneum]|uniref:F-box domain-containing protein n=1 Tax=Trifolium subterraneum TaxID=3900 RepID=A0A2Z6MTA1_TRISU|nr:hypothetical protein TSUD_258730 [Trifolium subterraneum]
MAMVEQLYLPEECWECIFKIFLDKCCDHNGYLQSLSVVSKQFLSITDRCKSSLTLFNQTLPFLLRLFQRFTNLTSLDLRHFKGNCNVLLTDISRFQLQLKSLNLSNHYFIPVDGLRVFSQQITTLTSLICSNIISIRKSDFFLIADCFPFLEELDLSFPGYSSFNVNSEIDVISLALPKLRKVNFSGNNYINDSSLFYLCKNCEFLEEIVMFNCMHLTQFGIASAIRERPYLRSLSFYTGLPNMELIDSLRSLKCLSDLNLSYSYISNQLLSSLADEGLSLRRLVLRRCRGSGYPAILYLLSKSRFLQHLDLENLRYLNDHDVAELSEYLLSLVSINLSHCTKLTQSTLHALVEKCPFLDEIRMEDTRIGKLVVEKNCSSFRDSVVNPRIKMKSLHLAYNPYLNNETIKLFASIFPNLQLLDVNNCSCISDEGIVEVLRCCKIVHLNLSSCRKVNLLGLNFQVPTLEVLNLSLTRIDDKTPDAISKSCSGLLQLDLKGCHHVTDKGVKQVIGKCTRLKEINVLGCRKVSSNVDFWTAMELSRPSLRNILPPSDFRPSNSKWKPLLGGGCFRC